jgi:hypothetical protein
MKNPLFLKSRRSLGGNTTTTLLAQRQEITPSVGFPLMDTCAIGSELRVGAFVFIRSSTPGIHASTPVVLNRGRVTGAGRG